MYSEVSCKGVNSIFTTRDITTQIVILTTMNCLHRHVMLFQYTLAPEGSAFFHWKELKIIFSFIVLFSLMITHIIEKDLRSYFLIIITSETIFLNVQTTSTLLFVKIEIFRLQKFSVFLLCSFQINNVSQSFSFLHVILCICHCHCIPNINAIL